MTLLEKMQEFGFDKICREGGKFPDLSVVKSTNYGREKVKYELHACNGIGIVVANGREIVDLFSVFDAPSALSRNGRSYWRGATIPEGTSMQTNDLARDIEGFTRVHEWRSNQGVFGEYSFNELGLRISEAGLLYSRFNLQRQQPAKLEATG